MQDLLISCGGDGSHANNWINLTQLNLSHNSITTIDSALVSPSFFPCVSELLLLLVSLLKSFFALLCFIYFYAVFCTDVPTIFKGARLEPQLLVR